MKRITNPEFSNIHQCGPSHQHVHTSAKSDRFRKFLRQPNAATPRTIVLHRLYFLFISSLHEPFIHPPITLPQFLFSAFSFFSSQPFLRDSNTQLEAPDLLHNSMHCCGLEVRGRAIHCFAKQKEKDEMYLVHWNPFLIQRELHSFTS
mgnify:CR=1 FL=1